MCRGCGGWEVRERMGSMAGKWNQLENIHLVLCGHIQAMWGAEVTQMLPSCHTRGLPEKESPPNKVKRSASRLPLFSLFLYHLQTARYIVSSTARTLIGPSPHIPIGCGILGHAVIGPCFCGARSVFWPGQKPQFPLWLTRGSLPLSSLSPLSPLLGFHVASRVSGEWGHRVHGCPSLQGWVSTKRHLAVWVCMYMWIDSRRCNWTSEHLGLVQTLMWAFVYVIVMAYMFLRIILDFFIWSDKHRESKEAGHGLQNIIPRIACVCLGFANENGLHSSVLWSDA